MAMLINRRTYSTDLEFVREGRGCATPRPNNYQIARNDERLRTMGVGIEPQLAVVVPVNFVHIIAAARGSVSDSQRADQLEVINSAFQPMGISFVEGSVTMVDNEAWYYMDKDSIEERQAKTAHHKNPQRYLNFYTGGIAERLLGWATYPWRLSAYPELDGVVLLDESLPGGNAERFNLGMTAVHEIGHWLGLFHTFEEGCSGFGDHVSDTTPHAEPNYGTPDDSERNGACQDGERAPVRNYMNYVDDRWMREFTSGQEARIWKHIRTYRSKLLD